MLILNGTKIEFVNDSFLYLFLDHINSPGVKAERRSSPRRQRELNIGSLHSLPDIEPRIGLLERMKSWLARRKQSCASDSSEAEAPHGFLSKIIIQEETFGKQKSEANADDVDLQSLESSQELPRDCSILDILKLTPDTIRRKRFKIIKNGSLVRKASGISNTDGPTFVQIKVQYYTRNGEDKTILQFIDVSKEVL
mmetsp:Transcript_17578/g.27163  ORF Transcript_17578/g.27163 Transcript_17578/m.27163 type:complete len:196 (-) Transcript_17578:1622-2209(-)|eukprot:CAMPEP_0170509576 /NCGR_PEP_ID=MMETSP0208-20121228/65289_1 /TAXON_ID=197538 /ORGANISM="Strombidium inclinatum, Strain S3" /LENGTH=195 /DNA_ID=CAMNT_0010792949 /DNA_START=1197 /DNA_END=1784 /DNA_ORIENTATION=+